MAAAAKIQPYTFDDFCVLVKDDQKADLIDGVIHMASPENTDANGLFMWLGGLIDLYVETMELGKVFGSRVAFQLGETNAPEPDIGFVKKGRLHLVKRGRVAGPPDVSIEIVSPESVERDYQEKRLQYQRACVPEYWIVDEMQQKVTLLQLASNDKYREVRPRKGELHSAVLSGFWLRPECLWQEPRPKKQKILREILSRQG